jgi:hypothetical protein
MDRATDPFVSQVLSLLLERYRYEQRNAAPAIGNRVRPPSPSYHERQAVDFLRNELHNHRNTAESVVSALTDDPFLVATANTAANTTANTTAKQRIPRNNNNNNNNNRNRLEECLFHHTLVQCEILEQHTVHERNGKTRRGNRRARGTCRICKKKTKWYCPACPTPNGGAKRAWYCPPSSNPLCDREYHRSAVCDTFIKTNLWGEEPDTIGNDNSDEDEEIEQYEQYE